MKIEVYRRFCCWCGFEFNKIKQENLCPRCEYINKEEELIGEWDNCVWDY